MSELGLDPLTFLPKQLGDVVGVISRRFGKSGMQVPRPPVDLLLPSAVQRWMEGAATAVGLEAEPIGIPLDELEGVLRRAECVLIPRGRGFLVLLEGGAARVTVLGPDLAPRRVGRRALARALRLERALTLFGEGPLASLSELLEIRASDTNRLERALSELAAGAELGPCWLFRTAAGEPYTRQLRRARVPGALALALGLGLLQAALGAGSWLVFGSEALHGRLDSGRLYAWALVLLLVIPFQLGSSWLLGEVAQRIGLSFKRRLFDGALRMPLDLARRDGVGGLIGRVNEAAAVEALCVAGGLGALGVAADWVMAVVLLSQTSYPAASIAVFLLMTLVLAASCFDLMRLQQRWMLERIRLTGGFVERLMGYRTRLVQEPRARWHDAEDRELEAYFASSRKLDRRRVAYGALPRLLPIGGIVLLVPLSVGPGSGGLGALVLTLVAIMTGASALSRLWDLLGLSVSATLAWRSASALFHASKLDPPTPHLYFQDTVAQTRAFGDVLLEARELSFRYPNRPRPAITGVNLRIERGDRVLIQGPSGRGKSTLLAILSGLRAPESGLLLVRGLDRHVLTPGQWQSTVAAVPQFHENHVFTNSLAFNLLMGRTWPPSAQDLDDARLVCDELGLGPLLARMPGGLFEPVGETGWQLSHGERSRVFIARALLQRAELTVLDESFGSLDPETLQQVIPCVTRRAGSLVVFAHL
jgi:ATP-binding cassette subfamily B protein